MLLLHQWREAAGKVTTLQRKLPPMFAHRAVRFAEYLVYLPKTFYGTTWKYMYTSHTMTYDFLSSMAGNHHATEHFSKDWHEFIRETPALESNSSGIDLHGDEKEEVEWLMNVERVGEWTQNFGPGSAKYQ